MYCVCTIVVCGSISDSTANLENLMSYSNKNPAWHRMHQSQHDARIQWEAQRASELRQDNPSLTRSEALRQASREWGKR